MWVTGSVMWAAASDESLKFGVQGATATNWFPRVNGARDNGIWLYLVHTNNKNYIKSSALLAFYERDLPVTSGLLSQKASNM